MRKFLTASVLALAIAACGAETEDDEIEDTMEETIPPPAPAPAPMDTGAMMMDTTVVDTTVTP